MKSSTKIFLLFFYLSPSIFAFTYPLYLIRNKSAPKLEMIVWGVQKLGQSVIGTGTVSTNVEEQDVNSYGFKRIPKGTGSDYRKDSVLESDEKKWTTLSNIDKFFQQKSILTSLSSNVLGSVEKIEQIHFIAKCDNILPASFPSNSIICSNMKSGGLLRDWSP